MLACAPVDLSPFTPIPTALAQTAENKAAVEALFIPVTEGRGPAEHIVRFEILPDATNYRLSDDAINALGEALLKKNLDAERRAAAELGAQTFGDHLGIRSAIGTVAEHALWLDEISSVNEVLAIVGLGVGFAQVAHDAALGRDDAALTGGIKTWMSFAISKWGWGSVQIGGVAIFVVDVLLRKWQSGLTEIATDVWTCHYQAWYREHPRSVGQWDAEIWKLYLAAEKKETARSAAGQETSPFTGYVDNVLNEYVARAFADELLPSYGNCSGSSMGLDHDFVKQIVMAEHKKLLERMLATKVMPRVADRLFLRNLKAQLWEVEAHLKPRLNAKMLLEVTAYGYPAGARVVMPLPAGGEWSGKLRADGTFRAEVTKFAIRKAGYPEMVRIETSEGSESRRLAVSGNHLIALFGTPQTPVVARYTLTEQSGSCLLTRKSPEGTRKQQVADAPAHAPQPVDFALLPNGSWVFGRFGISAGWSTASPGLTSGSAMTFGAPYYDDISGFDDCAMGFLMEETVAQGKCTVRRTDSKQLADGASLERTCHAPARLKLAGIFASVVTGDMQYYQIDGAEGRTIANLLKQSIRKGVVGAPAGLLPGTPSPAGTKP